MNDSTNTTPTETYEPGDMVAALTIGGVPVYAQMTASSCWRRIGHTAGHIYGSKELAIQHRVKLVPEDAIVLEEDKDVLSFVKRWGAHTRTRPDLAEDVDIVADKVRAQIPEAQAELDAELEDAAEIVLEDEEDEEEGDKEDEGDKFEEWYANQVRKAKEYVSDKNAGRPRMVLARDYEPGTIYLIDYLEEKGIVARYTGVLEVGAFLTESGKPIPTQLAQNVREAILLDPLDKDVKYLARHAQGFGRLTYVVRVARMIAEQMASQPAIVTGEVAQPESQPEPGDPEEDDAKPLTTERWVRPEEKWAEVRDAAAEAAAIVATPLAASVNVDLIKRLATALGVELSPEFTARYDTEEPETEPETEPEDEDDSGYDLVTTSGQSGTTTRTCRGCDTVIRGRNWYSAPCPKCAKSPKFTS